MSDVTNKALVNEEDMELEFLQFDTELYGQDNYQNFSTVDELQVDGNGEVSALSLGQLQQEVIDEHENFLQKLTQMVELEREHVDEVYRGHEPAVRLNQQLREEMALMKQRVNQAFEIVAKMQTIFED